MAKQNFDDMLGLVEKPNPKEGTSTTPAAKPQPRKRPPRSSLPEKGRPGPRSPGAGQAKWQTLEAKTTRLRSEQRTALTAAARQLNTQKAGEGERITDNTLIRVAVDLLLARGDELQGTTEEELKQSMNL